MAHGEGITFMIIYLLLFVFLKAWLYFNKMAELMVALLRAAQKGSRELRSWPCALSQVMTCTQLYQVRLHQNSGLSSPLEALGSIRISSNIKR